MPRTDPLISPRAQAVLIEDDEGVRRSLQLVLHARGYDVRAYASAMPFLENLRSEEVDLLVTDYRLPDGDGLGVLRALHRHGWHGRSILVTAFSSTMLTESAKACGFDAILEKPLRPNELAGAIAG
jgi:FixJ family two-component response regulator